MDSVGRRGLYSYELKVGHVGDLLFNMVQDGKGFNLGTMAKQLLGDTGDAWAEAENGVRVDGAFLEMVNGERFNWFNHITS